MKKENRHEMEFRQHHQLECGCELLFEPACFKVHSEEYGGLRYTPDFYCPKTHAFFEVCGTRQAASQNHWKIRRFMTYYPWLKFLVIRWDQQSAPKMIRSGIGYGSVTVDRWLHAREEAKKLLSEASLHHRLEKKLRLPYGYLAKRLQNPKYCPHYRIAVQLMRAYNEIQNHDKMKVINNT